MTLIPEAVFILTDEAFGSAISTKTIPRTTPFLPIRKGEVVDPVGWQAALTIAVPSNILSPQSSSAVDTGVYSHLVDAVQAATNFFGVSAVSPVSSPAHKTAFAGVAPVQL